MIKIIDNFFSKNDIKLVQDFTLNKAHYTPRFLDDKEKTKENFFGNRCSFENNIDILNLFKKQTELKFNLKILKLHHDSGIDQRNLDQFKPHTDDEVAKINILIMIYGPTAVTNGTVFYTDGELDLHVGFRENRAVMFPSNKFHSSHASNIPNLKRYSASLFIQDYEIE